MGEPAWPWQWYYQLSCLLLTPPSSSLEDDLGRRMYGRSGSTGSLERFRLKCALRTTHTEVLWLTGGTHMASSSFLPGISGLGHSRHSVLAGVYGIGPVEALAMCRGFRGSVVSALEASVDSELRVQARLFALLTSPFLQKQPLFKTQSGRRRMTFQIALQIFLLKQIVAKCQEPHIFPMKRSQSPPGHFKL